MIKASDVVAKPWMIHKCIHLFLVFLLLMLFVFSGCQKYQTVVPITGITSLKVVIDNNYPPFSFLDEDGNLQGILIDRWRLWEKKTGIKVEITGMDWGQALQRMQSGEFDVIDTIFETDSRKLFYDFSEPYQNIDVPIYFNNRISGIVDVNSLKGFSVAVKSNDAAVEYLHDHGIDNLVEYESYEAILKAAANNEVVVFVVDKPPADYYLYLNGIENKFNNTQPLYSGEFHRAVLKGNFVLLQIVENGFDQISKAEYKAIDQKWYGTSAVTDEVWRIIQTIGLIALVVMLVLIMWNYSLQSQVKRKTNTLLESEKKFRQIFETSAVGMTIMNANGEFTAANSMILKTLGYSEEEYNKLSLESITHPEDKKSLKKSYQEIWGGRKDSFTAEKRLKHKNGQYVFGRITTFTIKDTNNNPQFAIEIFEDITESKYDERLRDSIFKIAQAAIAASSTDELFKLIHEIISKIMPVDNFFIGLYDSKTNLLHFPFFIDQYEEEADPIEPGHGLSDYVMRHRKTLLATEEVFERLMADGEVELIGAKPVDWLGVPLIVNDKAIGVLATQSYSPDVHFTQVDANFLEFVSTQIAQAIELKRAEEAQHLSEMRYRYLFEDSPVSIWEEDFSEVKRYITKLMSNGVNNLKQFFVENPEKLIHCVSLIKVVDVNQQALKLTRAKSKEELFKNLNKIFSFHHAQEFLEEILNIADGITEFERETVSRTIDGETIFVSQHWTAVQGYENDLSKVIVSMSDITLNKKAEAELQASEERYRHLVDNLGEGIILIDQETKFVFCNPSAMKTFGMTKNEAIKYKLVNLVNPDQLDYFAEQIRLLQTLETNNFELEIIRPDGERRNIQIFAHPQYEKSTKLFIGIFGIVHDITERKKAEEKRIRRAQFEEMLTNISTRFINVDNEDIDSEINTVLKHIGQFEKVDRTYVFHIDPQKRTMSCTHEWCKEGVTPTMPDMQNLPVYEFPWFMEQITCDPLIITRLKDMPKNAAKENAIFEKQGIKSLANFPMWVNLELIGFIGFDTVFYEHSWDPDNAAMMQQFTNVVSNAIERSRLLKILKDRAIRDELTGVLNRRGFLQIANTELVRAHRYNHPVGMILLDMDHLKKVNDTYGHAAGDLALQEISKHCKLNIREIDVLGRWGGDEFVILLPESDFNATMNVAKRLQQSICDHSIQVSGQEIKLTISAGVALAEKNVVTIDELFRNADAALYLAKAAGRNRIMVNETREQTHLSL